MFVSFVRQNGSPGHYYVPAQSSEKAVWAHFKCSADEFRDRVFPEMKDILLHLWKEDNFAESGVKVEGGKLVSNVSMTIRKTERFGDIEVSQIGGFLSKNHISDRINYLLHGFPPDDFLYSLYDVGPVRKRLLLPDPKARESLKGLRPGLLYDVFTQSKMDIDKLQPDALGYLHLKDETLGVTWSTPDVIYVERIPETFRIRIALKSYGQPAKSPEKSLKLHIIGPITLTEWKSAKRGMHIYLFGDMHIKEMRCKNLTGSEKVQTIVSFFKETINANQEKVIDLFVEEDYLSPAESATRKLVMPTSFLADVRNAFNPCLKANRKFCPDKKTRFHYSDIRSAPGFLKNVLKIVDKYYGEDPKRFSAGTFQEEVRPLITDPKIFNPGAMMVESRVAKQLEAIEEADLREYIVDYFSRSIVEISGGLLRIFGGYNRANLRQTVDEVLYNSIVIWVSIWMDFYTTARMFRSYKVQKAGYSDQPAKNIMTYFGDLHCRDISAFLATLPDFVQVSRSESMIQGKDFQCLKVESVVPFFGGRETDKGPWKVE